MVAGDQQSASLTLNPPDLGPLQVVLNVHNATAHASFTAAQPEVRQALEAALPKLREMLGDAGIQLGQASVNSGSAHQQAPDRQPSAAPQAINRIGGTETAPSRVTRLTGGTSGSGLVDTFV
jgi:flagellar hook-length control protein FliK